MKIYLASASIDDIRWGTASDLVDGIVTTPALLAGVNATAGDGQDVLAEICRTVAVPLCAAVTSVSPGDMYQDARDLAKMCDHIVVQIPFVEDAVPTIRRLSAEGIRVGVTLVFNPAQAIIAAKLGASMVTIALDRLEEVGQRSTDIVAEIRAIFDAAGTECDIIANLPRGAEQFAGCALAGAHGVIVTPAVLRSLLVHPLTDRGIDQFLHDLSKRPKVRVS
jgi:transaldolase